MNVQEIYRTSDEVICNRYTRGIDRIELEAASDVISVVVASRSRSAMHRRRPGTIIANRERLGGQALHVSSNGASGR